MKNTKKILTTLAGLSLALVSNAATTVTIGFEDYSGEYLNIDYTSQYTYVSSDTNYYATSTAGGITTTLTYQAVYGGTSSYENDGQWYEYDWYAGAGASISNKTDTTVVDYTNDLASTAGGGSGGSDNYAVLYLGAEGYTEISDGVYSTVDTTPYVTFSEGVYVESIDICMTAYSYDVSANGNGYTYTGYISTVKDSFLNLLVYGVLENGDLTNACVEIALAINDDGTISFTNDWYTLNLTALNDEGTLEGLSFAMSSNIESYGYLTLPTYVAIDNIVIAVPEPSEYALIFGLLSMGFIVYRRRKSQK